MMIIRKGGIRLDELLLRRAQNGDPEAFGLLMEPLERLVWRVCWHYIGERESASDCAQDAMLRIWRSLSGYRGDCAFKTWVYRVAANCCMDFLRKKKRDKSESIEPLKEAGFDPADPEPGTEEKVIAAERKRQLRECITRLPEDQREALIMTQLEGVSSEDAAERLGVSEGTVKSRVNRAKMKLKEWMAENGELSAPANVQKSERRDLS